MVNYCEVVVKLILVLCVVAGRRHGEAAGDDSFVTRLCSLLEVDLGVRESYMDGFRNKGQGLHRTLPAGDVPSKPFVFKGSGRVRDSNAMNAMIVGQFALSRDRTRHRSVRRQYA
ncbi:hypothetical protein EVAR_64407_1 [Eumeta japonica]|uniref:Secreted protein n=1 Tax=Eumeta variegata TaxID=151549 RepID=A0A4C2A1V3_EUMVA|nr:hypothetical protein EVAR_64407_1 [Eumeta japonica]